MTMDYIIKRMDELTSEDNRIFGNKVFYLTEARKKGVRVLDGLCVCMKNRGCGKETDQFKSAIQSAMNYLWKGDKCYIVRSSSQYEDRKNCAFPGIYRSRKDITSLEDVITAIDECYESTFSDKAKRYMEYMGIEGLKQEYFSVLIQEQMEPEYSGVLFTTMPVETSCFKDRYYVEMVEGHCQDMLQGKETAHSYILKKTANAYRVQESYNPLDRNNDGIEKILQQLGDEADKAVHLFGRNLDIEWGWAEGRIVIFQIRPISVREGTAVPVRLQERLLYGLKAEAMMKFQKVGLFPKTLLIIGAGEGLNEVIRQVQEAEFSNSQITIRFSCKNELGLPRFFAKNKEEALKFIEETYNDKWAVIIHESIAVTDSYELYMDEEKGILEHVPGMWESDVQISTDVWIFNRRTVKAYMCKGERIAKYENAYGVEYKKIRPYTGEQVCGIAQKMWDYLQRVRDNWPCEKGVNFHFVGDQEEKIYFLNKRNSKRIDFHFEERGEKIEIRSRDDILRWDRKTDILLKVNLKRGEEGILEEYVPFLKESDARVYVEFGILSHPAIMLREMGVQVYPLYSGQSEYEFVLM